MATTSTLKIKTAFADEATRDHEFGPFATTAAAITNIKTNIATFNNNIENLQGLYLSDGGASCVGITAASIVTATETEIYNAAIDG